MPSRPLADRDVVAIFAKAPSPGYVKTRLAAEIGQVAAVALYRRLGRQVVAAAANGNGSHATVVWYTPATKRRVLRAWLQGIPGVQLRAQSAGDLGQRLQHTLARHFDEGAKRIVIVGADCPGVTPETLARSFAALRAADLVLGPAEDGGYYLIGMRAPQPGLFQNMPWSTDRVFRTTLHRARALGCSCRVLRRLRDVDTLADAKALGLLS